MSGYPFKPSALAFDKSGTYLATGGSETVTIWNFEGEGPEGTTPLILSHHREPLTSLTFSIRDQTWHQEHAMDQLHFGI